MDNFKKEKNEDKLYDQKYKPDIEINNETRNQENLIKKDIETDSNTNSKANKSIKSDLLDILKIVVFAFVLSILLNKFVITTSTVISGSMENTIMTGDKIIANRLSYLFNEPKRFDIIVFHFPDNEEDIYLKRIIGLPGDKIEIKDGKVFINDSIEPLAEDYLHEEMKGSFGPYNVPEDSYFLLGDNRNSSTDSREWENTYLKKDKIIGKAFLRYYPIIKIIN